MDLELEWARPAGAALLALPVLLLLLARVRTRPERRATGTFAVWRRIASALPVPARRERQQVPPAVWLLAAALASGALALAGPRLVRPAAPRTWTAVVDHSSSTGLPWVPPGDGDAPGARGETRLERALGTARELLRSEARSGDRVRWTSSARPAVATDAGELPPRAWRAHPPWHAPEPEWALHDRAGAIWVTDAARGTEAAGIAASGGCAVPGPVAWEGRARIDWNGEELVRVPDALAARAVAVEGELPAPVARAVESWREARGLALDAGGAGPAVRVSAHPRGGEGDLGEEVEPLEVEVARDGWRAAALVPSGGLPAPAERLPWRPWLTTPGPGGEIRLVDSAPGRVRVALLSLDEPGGDPAAFAVSWAELLDGSILPPPEIVPLAERLPAGEPAVRPPVAPPPHDGGPPRPIPVDAALALAAALLALASAAAGLLR